MQKSSAAWRAVATVILLLLQFSSEAGATSCVPISVWIYGDCTENGCDVPLFIDSESGYGSCSRLPIVKDGSDFHKEILELEIRTAGMKSRGRFELEIRRNWYYPEYRLESFSDYLEAHRGDNSQGYRGKFRPELRKTENESFVEIRANWINERSETVKRLRLEKAKDGLFSLSTFVPKSWAS